MMHSNLIARPRPIEKLGLYIMLRVSMPRNAHSNTIIFISMRAS